MPRPKLPARSRTSGVAPGWLAAAGVVIVVLGVLLIAGGGSSKSDTSASTPTAVYRQLDTAFTLDGARFEVKPANDAKWADEMRRAADPRAGTRWVAVGVPIRNLSRADLRPRRLGYHIVTSAGLVVGPELVEPLPGSLDFKGRLLRSKLTSVHLGFRVPNESRDLTLALDAGGIRKPAVRVLLGGEG